VAVSVSADDPKLAVPNIDAKAPTGVRNENW
jgi:hypothetical protein